MDTDTARTGDIRHLDEFGRITIPTELRRALNFREGDAIEMIVDKKANALLLSKYQPIALDSITGDISLTLRSFKIAHAIYSDTDLIPSVSWSHTLQFPTEVKPEWKANAHKEHCIEDGDLNVFPVIAYGEIRGYIAIPASDGFCTQALTLVKLASIRIEQTT